MENSQLRFLITDDDEAVRKLTNLLLKRPYPTSQKDFANDGTELVKIVRKSEQSYSVIISDYKMPNKNGLKALLELRTSGDLTPAIIQTGTLGDLLDEISTLSRPEVESLRKIGLIEKPYNPPTALIDITGLAVNNQLPEYDARVIQILATK